MSKQTKSMAWTMDDSFKVSLTHVMHQFNVDGVGERPVFVFGSGNRCGSTLLQRLLNSNRHIMIWGEQHGYLNSMVPAFLDLMAWSEEKSPDRETFMLRGYDNFVPNMMPTPAALQQAAAAHIREVFAVPALALHRPIWGFKEVRYAASIALTLQTWFPEARFIHLTRNIRDSFVSMKRWELLGNWRREWALEALKNWVEVNNSFAEQGMELRKLLSVRYEDMTKDPQSFIASLAEFLELPAKSFDSGVFRHKLDGTDQYAPRSVLSGAEEAILLEIPGIIEVARHYGYTL